MSAHPQAVEVENLTRRFGDVVALDRINLSIRRGEFFSLLGPSGCGKTTLLRIIAGLEVPDDGILRIGGVDAREIPAHRRPVNTVFQSYALFPHLKVQDNVSFGLRMKKVPQAELEKRVRQAMELVEIESLAQRKPSQLSGGQKQRVALARAIVNEPQVLLLDEPLGALDLKLRKQLQIELLKLQRRLGITFLYVTHDQEEALVLSDRIAVMREGKLEQVGDSETLYERPRTRFVSQFLGTCTLLEATIIERSEQEFRAETSLGILRVTSSPPVRNNCTLAIRPEKMQICVAPPPTSQNTVDACVIELIYVGSETHYELRAGNETLRAEIMNSQASGSHLDIGQKVSVVLPSSALIVLED